MSLPCRFNSTNGYTVEYSSLISNERKARGVIATFTITLPGSEQKEFIFINEDKLILFYHCILNMFTTINANKTSLRTIELPSIKLDEFIGVFLANNKSCLISLKSRHITKRDDIFKTTDIIELTSESLHILAVTIGATVYGEGD